MESRIDLKTTFNSLGLVEWQHVVVRQKSFGQVNYLGGGFVSSIVRRFGSRTIIKSLFIDGVFVVFVE